MEETNRTTSQETQTSDKFQSSDSLRGGRRGGQSSTNRRYRDKDNGADFKGNRDRRNTRREGDANAETLNLEGSRRDWKRQGRKSHDRRSGEQRFQKRENRSYKVGKEGSEPEVLVEKKAQPLEGSSLDNSVKEIQKENWREGKTGDRTPSKRLSKPVDRGKKSFNAEKKPRQKGQEASDLPESERSKGGSRIRKDRKAEPRANGDTENFVDRSSGKGKRKAWTEYSLPELVEANDRLESEIESLISRIEQIKL